MASRKVTLLLAAATIGLGTVFVVRNMASQGPTHARPDQQAAAISTVQIAIATRDLPTGTILKESDLKWAPWAANADTGAMLVKGKVELSRYAGAVVRDGFRSGDPILASRVAHSNDQGFLAAVLTPGMRAMSVSLSPMSQVGGFIFPGDRVDVILTHSYSRRQVSDMSERRVSETIIQNVRVLALDQRSDNQSNDPKVAQLATLEVSPKDAEKLAMALDIAFGHGGNKNTSLMLTLRSLALEETAQGAQKEAPKKSVTWDSDVSESFSDGSGNDSLVHRVQIMRGKDATDKYFERQR
ncbi:MAG: Flp pilus assembly protein CpaB [Alphaproteobacteria bacterium]|nr:Flp pilus assembly protein CpaB [Alphaproteobacteria bacterium]